MTDTPPLWGRMFARFQGEVPTTTLEAYRRASLPVFEQLEQAESRRLAGATDGLDPWTLPPATRAASVCAWNAFVLQALGNDILDADDEAHPATAGFVPPVTAEQVLAWFTEVETWLDRAQQAHANPEYRLDVEVPAELPTWRDTHPCPPAHLRGMLRALHTVGEHAAASLAALEAVAPATPGQQMQMNHIRQLHASARSKARYAAELHGADATPDVRVRVEQHAREAIERFFTLGQLIADPALVPVPGQPEPALPAAAKSTRTKSPSSGAKSPALLDEPGFDIWCLTDENARAALKHDPKAEATLRRLWARDPDRAATVALQADIQSALERGDVEYATVHTGGRVGYWHQPPWGSVYAVRRRVELNGQQLLQGERFVLALSQRRNRSAFWRRLLVGRFSEEGEVSYGSS